MPSSPEAAVAWEPAELAGPTRVATVAPPVPSRPRHAPLFEVTAGAAIPSAVLDPARRAAESAGYAAGWAAGIAAARSVSDAEARATRTRAEQAAQTARGRLEQGVAALDAAARQLTERSAPNLAELQELIASSAFAIAEAVVGVALRDDDVRGRAAVSRALALVPDGHDVEVALHPADLATVTASEAGLPANVRLVADPALAPGDAVATCPATTVDARIGAALERVREALSS